MFRLQRHVEESYVFLFEEGAIFDGVMFLEI